ncbi:FAD-binding oxidoreductase [Frondihabitans sp. VKM Ac-2883]|uniref:FAD-binding oxidoreductase n=1 Tax=Frondihabitans sp. VKM Ac-2883 TaxID=2783823 RepID=UPI001889F021|nr:FAD-binding oxidoreductase [Frondihabitans sp. VKM Ac-2883]MBF4577277.1 FAD-binding oxidoreductase [Frondihabitans sp. VKM Ac-2883]
MTTTPEHLAALVAELRELLGERGVSVELAAREKASVDGSRLSPVISAQLPLGLADVVAFPTTADEIAAVVGAASRHGVPITPRGKGTGNYGQAIPFTGGLVLDMTKARAVVSVGDGELTAEAGATMVSLEQAANKAGQQILMYPSTAQSSLGGFLSGGSGGTGSIKHGSNHQGFVRALDVVHADGTGEIVHVEGDEAQLYVHNYGTAGIIVRATITLEPLQEWLGFFASFDTFEQLLPLIRAFGELDPLPRLASGDLATLADALPSDPGIPQGRASLRAILDASTVARATELVEAAGGRVEDVREGPQTSMKISMMSYNHPIEWLQKAYPDTYFHVEVSGDALIDRIDEVHAVYPGGMLHIETAHGRPIGMLAGTYSSAEDVYAGFDRLKELGVGFHNPHQWFVDFEPARTRELAATTDPNGLLNPGKLVDATINTGAKVS